MGDLGKVKETGCQDNAWEVYCIILKKDPHKESSEETKMEANIILFKELFEDNQGDP